jgi:signal transduction histidine kinase
MGTYSSTLLKTGSGSVQVVAPQGSFRGDITSIVCEAPNILWIGSAGGLHRWENGRIHSWDTRDGLLTASIRALLRDPDGTLWLGTAGGGLARFKNGRFFHITTRQGLIDDIISEVIADDFGFLWLGCNRGIMRIDRREVEALAAGKIAGVQPMIFQRNEGLLKEQCAGGHSPTVMKTKDGRLLFPTVAGVAEIDPRRLLDLAKVPTKATIERFLVDDHSVPWDVPPLIRPGKHRLEMSYTAPVLRGGEWTHFRYRMKGLDADWVTAGTDRVAKYDGLRPGKYDFQVQASDGQGRWIEPGASITFTQKAFIWQTLWFGIAVAVLVFCVGGGAAWWHTHRKHRQHVEELERTRQLEAELAHVSRVSLIGELSASFAHELNQPLAAILSNAQAALRFLDNDPNDVSEVRAILHDISASDRRASEIIGRMRAMMKKEKIRMELGDINVNVTEVLLLLRGDLVKRGVKVSTQLADDAPLVKGDHIQLQQVILNLLINGCDAMGGNAPESRQLLVTTAREGASQVRVSIVDQGTGIPPATMNRIFEAFYTTKGSGLGMGLAICREIVRAHGGKLWATNNTESGATFHFTLPLAEILSTSHS